MERLRRVFAIDLSVQAVAARNRTSLKKSRGMSRDDGRRRNSAQARKKILPGSRLTIRDRMQVAKPGGCSSVVDKRAPKGFRWEAV